MHRDHRLEDQGRHLIYIPPHMQQVRYSCLLQPSPRRRMSLASSSNPSQRPHQLDDLRDDREIPALFNISRQALPVVTDPGCPEPPRPSDLSIHTGVDRLSWERLIRSPPAEYERVSLITNIFSNRDEIEMVRHLCEDDAQAFINVVYEVRPYTLSFPKNRTVDLNSNSCVSSIRRWTTSIAHYG